MLKTWRSKKRFLDPSEGQPLKGFPPASRLPLPHNNEPAALQLAPLCGAEIQEPHHRYAVSVPYNSRLQTTQPLVKGVALARHS